MEYEVKYFKHDEEKKVTTSIANVAIFCHRVTQNIEKRAYPIKW